MSAQNIIPPPLLANKDGWPYVETLSPYTFAGMEYLPRISILVPSYNQGQYLEENLRSILLQRYPDLEILVADGGSTDSTAAVLAHYASNIHWQVSERDRGTWDADNKALAHATGQYVLVLNSDDYLLPGALYRLVSVLQGPARPRWLAGKVRAVNADGETKSVFYPKPQPAVGGLTFAPSCWLYHPAVLVERSLLAGGFAETDLMDHELWLRLEKAGHYPTLVPYTLAALRFHQDCKSFDTGKMLKSQGALLRSFTAAHTFTVAQKTELLKLADLITMQASHADMVAKLRDGREPSALSTWLGYTARHPASVANRAHLGALKRIFTGFGPDHYNPMAFLERPWQPIPDDVY